MTIDKIKEIVETETGYNLTHPSRKTELVYTRAMYYKLCREYTLHSLEVIGKSVNRNHATVLHGLKLYRDWIDQHEERYMQSYEKIDKLVSKEFKRENAKHRGRDFYKRKYAKVLLELRDVNTKHRNLKKLINV